jgi:hypothetical protein
MWQFIKDLFQSLLDFIYRIFISIMDFFKDLLFFVLDSLLDGVIFVLESVGDIGTALNPLEYISAIPNETRAFMAMVGFNEIMTILVTAILIRLTLQLIPFVRLGN